MLLYGDGRYDSKTNKSIILVSINFIYSSKRFDGQLMWWRKQHICLRYLDFSVCLIISTNLIMRSRLSVSVYYNFLSFFIYCYPFCLLVCCDIYFVKKRLKTLLQLFKKWLKWCNRTLQFLKRLILTIHILKKINLHFQVKELACFIFKFSKALLWPSRFCPFT